MKLHHVLFFCLLSGAPCDGQTERYVQGTEGGSIRFECSFQLADFAGKYFCKEDCTGEDVLVQTTGFEAQNGRYSLQYSRGSLYVSIAELMKSDAGRYSCEARRFIINSRRQFEVVVIDAPTTLPEITATTTLLETNQPPSATTTLLETNQQHSDFFLVLAVCITVGVVVLLLAVVLLLLYTKKRKDSGGSNKTGNSEGTGTKIVLDVNSHPVSTRGASTYQSLDPASRDLDQIYFNLT
ncbi:uncharacterized protein [Enoplosus armatus]|uniref:uncharacterized protein isoform X2 n=1 Tax=Enoplosus armatus TaxID=215367 RepID=UPI003996B088